MEILKLNFIKNHIISGSEVLVRENKDTEWKLNWFDKISKVGFHTYEFQNTPLRYLLKADTPYMFKKMGLFGDLIGQYDFNDFINKDGKK
jgi:hypothetical protein